MKSYYAKELPEATLYLDGKAYRFDLMETENPRLCELLDTCARQRKGGIIKLSEDQYLEQSKKKAASPPISQKWEREEVKQKLPNYNRPRFVSKENVAAKGKAGAAPVVDQPQPVDLSAYIPKTATGLLH